MKPNESPKIAVVMPVRNEEKLINETIQSLIKQTISPYRIIVIDDGSTDKTPEILKKLPVEVVTRKNKEDLYSKKEIAITLNSGLEKLKNDDNCDFILKLDADHLLPPDYLEKIISKMNSNPNLMICSGVIEGEYSKEPRHSGRVIKYNFWKSLGLKYPVNYAYEDYILFKARSLGYDVISFPDIITQTKRKTRSRYSNPKSYYNFGKGMNALGYSLFYMLGKCSLLFLKNPLGAFYFMKGYFARNTELYESDLRNYVKKSQNEKIMHNKLDNLKRAFNLLKK